MTPTADISAVRARPKRRRPPEQDGDRHILKSTDEYQPTHAEQDNHQVLFIGWTATDNSEAVYERGDGDSLPTLCGRTVTISGDMVVYAVWGLDGDDDGKPDVTEDDHHITGHRRGQRLHQS